MQVWELGFVIILAAIVGMLGALFVYLNTQVSSAFSLSLSPLPPPSSLCVPLSLLSTLPAVPAWHGDSARSSMSMSSLSLATIDRSFGRKAANTMSSEPSPSLPSG